MVAYPYDWISDYMDIHRGWGELLWNFGHILEKADGGLRTLRMYQASFEGTTLEIYNYVSHKRYTKSTDGTVSLTHHLSEAQKECDQFAGKWKGKVFLKNKEDCPPCSACGLKYDNE
jgi:hypothetical protein